MHGSWLPQWSMDKSNKIVVFKSITFTCAHHDGDTTATKHTQDNHSTDHDHDNNNNHATAGGRLLLHRDLQAAWARLKTDVDMRKLLANWRRRLVLCVQHNGDVFEHLAWQVRLMSCLSHAPFSVLANPFRSPHIRVHGQNSQLFCADIPWSSRCAQGMCMKARLVKPAKEPHKSSDDFPCCLHSVPSPRQSPEHNSHSTRLDSTTISFSDHLIHDLMSPPSSNLWTNVRFFNGKIGRSIELNMAFFDMFNSTEPVVPKYPFRWNKKWFKMSSFQHFSKTGNIYFFVPMDWIWRCLTMRHISLLFFPNILIKKVFFFRHLVRPEARPMTSKMSRTARSRQPPSWPPKWPPNPQI